MKTGRISIEFKADNIVYKQIQNVNNQTWFFKQSRCNKPQRIVPFCFSGCGGTAWCAERGTDASVCWWEELRLCDRPPLRALSSLQQHLHITTMNLKVLPYKSNCFVASMWNRFQARKSIISCGTGVPSCNILLLTEWIFTIYFKLNLHVKKWKHS